LQAFEELYEHAGTQFDAELVSLFYKFLEASLQIEPTNALKQNMQ
jgi:hypothetical protein